VTADDGNAGVVQELWLAFERRDFDAARDLLSDDLVVLWPHSGERIVGADTFIAINRDYPGDWHITIERIIAVGDTVVSAVAVRLGETTWRTASIFDLRDGKIDAVTDYWVEAHAEKPPEWRRRLSERQDFR